MKTAATNIYMYILEILIYTYICIFVSHDCILI